MPVSATAPPPRPPGRDSAAPFWIALVLLAVLLGEALLQSVYRLANGDWLARRTQPRIYVGDSTRCYGLRPSLAYRHATNEFSVDIFTNAQGFRTDSARRPTLVPKPAGTTRVLFLGPSFAFGWGVSYEESYAGLADRALRRSHAGVEVVDAGVPAQPIAWQLCWLRAAGRGLQPDIIVQTVYMVPENIESSCPSHLRCPIVRDGFLYTAEPRAGRRLLAAAKRSAIVFYGFYLVQHIRSAAPAAGTGDELRDPAHPPERPRPSWTAERYAEYRRFAREVTSDSTDVLFVFVPLSYMVHPSDARRWAHLGVGRVSPGAVARERERVAALAELLSATGTEFVDPTPALARTAENGRAYYWLDVHLTALGNRAVAAVLVPALRAMLDRRALGGTGPRRPTSGVAYSRTGRAAARAGSGTRSAP